MDNKNHIDQLFSGVFENYELKPSSDVWNRIENEMDNTHKAPKNIPYSRYAAVLFVFVSLCFLALPVNRRGEIAQIRNYPIQNAEVFDANNAIASNDNIIEVSEIKSPITNKKSNAVATISTQENVPGLENTNTLNSIIASKIKSHTQTDDFINPPAFMDEDQDLTADNMNIIDRIYNSDVAVPLFSYDYIASENDNEAEAVAFNGKNLQNNLHDYNMRGLYVGISGSYNQTAILEYGNLFKEERPIQPSLKFGTSKGFVFGYNFSNKLGIQAEYIYNSIQGQNYVTSEDGDITQKSLSLSYDLIPVTARVKVGRISNITHKPVVLNYVAGAQYGMLRSYRLPQDKLYEPTDKVFKADEISIVLGLEYEVYIQDNLYISAGARGTISNDISLNDGLLSDSAKRDFVFGLRASLNYVFK